MLKKLFGFILTVGILSAASTVFAVLPYHNTEEENIPVGLLDSLGIIEREEYAEYTNEITKGAFVKWMVRLSGAEESAMPTNPRQVFTDVSADSDIAAVVEYAYNKGIVCGNGYGSVDADKTFTVNDGATMAARAVGYDINEDLLSEAKMELMRGMNAGETVTVEIAMELIWNALELKPIRRNYNGAYSIDNEITILEGLFNTYCIEGIIDADSVMNIYSGTSEIGDNKISVNGQIYDTVPEIGAGYAGLNAEVFIRENDGTETVICIMPVKNEVLVYDASDLQSYANNQIDTTEKEVIRVSESAITIKDFKLVYVPANGYDLPDDATVVTIENNNDRYVDCVFIYSPSYGIVSSVSTSENKVYLKGLKTGGYDLGEYKNVLLYDFAGNQLNIKDITSGNMAEFYAIEDKSLFVGYFSNNSVELTFSAMYETSHGMQARATDGKEYKISPCFGTLDGQKKIKVGEKHKVIFDSKNRVAALYTVSFGDLNYGYLYNYYNSDDSMSGDELVLHIYSVNDGMLKVSAASKIRMVKDGIEYTVNENMLIQQFDVDFEESLILYQFNNNGEISKIEYPSNDNFDYGFRCVGTAGSATSGAMMYDARAIHGTICMIGGQILFDANKTKCLIVPQDKSDEDAWRVIPVSNAIVKNKYYQSVKGYGIAPDSITADIIVIEEDILLQSYADSYSVVPIIVSGFERKYDNETEEVYNAITGYLDGTETSFRLKEEALPQYITTNGEIIPLEVGDVVRITSDYYDEVVSIKLLYDESERRAYGISDGMYDHSSYGYGYSQRTNSGTPYKIVGNAMFMIKDGETEVSSDIFQLDECTIYEYDGTLKNPIKVITVDDMETVTDNPTTTDKVFIQLSYQKNLITVVYK